MLEAFPIYGQGRSHDQRDIDICRLFRIGDTTAARGVTGIFCMPRSTAALSASFITMVPELMQFQCLRNTERTQMICKCCARAMAV